MVKFCSRCKSEKSKNEFYRDKNRKDGHYPICKKCNAEDVKKYRAKPGVMDKIKETRRKLRKRKPGRHWKEYGINMTAEEYSERYIEQKERCMLCGIHQSKLKQRLCVDHNHNTGQCRGLVCIPCNTLIGIVENKSDAIIKIEEYLTFWINKEVRHRLP